MKQAHKIRWKPKKKKNGPNNEYKIQQNKIDKLS